MANTDTQDLPTGEYHDEKWVTDSSPEWQKEWAAKGPSEISRSIHWRDSEQDRYGGVREVRMHGLHDFAWDDFLEQHNLIEILHEEAWQPNYSYPDDEAGVLLTMREGRLVWVGKTFFAES